MAIYYSIFLLLLFYFLLIIEFLLPTGGMLGAAAVAAMIATVAVAFSHSILAGTVMLLIVVATTPIVFMGMVRFWPHTPIGRRMLNRRPGEVGDAVPERKTASGTPLSELVGRIGVAKTDLLPSGLVVVDSQKLDAVSSGMAIDAGSKVVVTSVEAGKIHVRAAPNEPLEPSESKPSSPPSLEKPLESFDFD